MNSKKILFLILLTALAKPIVASAAIAACKEGYCTNDLCNLVCNFRDSLVGITGGLVIIGWVVVGILFLLATQEPSKLNTAKTALFIVIAGTLILMLAPIAVAFVGGLFGIS